MNRKPVGTGARSEVKSISRRVVLQSVAASAVIPGVATKVSGQVDEELSEQQLDELENIISEIFGEDEPLKVGMEIEEEEDSGFISSFFGGGEEGSDNSDDVQKSAVKCANSICSTFSAGADVRAKAEEVGEIENDFSRQTFRAQHVLAVLVEEGLVKSITPNYVKAVRRSIPETARYLPLVGSCNNVIEAACKVNADKPESIIDFYTAVAAFCIEVAFFKFSVGYRLSFKATNILATRSTFARLLQYTNPKMYGLILSEIHWAIRQGVTGTSSVVGANTLTFAVQVTRDLKEQETEGKVEGVNDEIDISRTDLARLDLFDCNRGKDSLREWIQSLKGNSQTADRISDRGKEIVNMSC